MGFFATFLTLHIARTHKFPIGIMHIILPAILWLWAGLVAYSRFVLPSLLLLSLTIA